MLHYRSVFISDIHLGIRDSHDVALLKWFRTFECDNLYLVGDILDFWALKRRIYWPQTHNDVLQKILRMGRKGTQIYYIPGNHDEFMRHFIGYHFGNIKIENSVIHITPAGQRYLVIHGDKFDPVVGRAKWLSKIGAVAYDALLYMNTYIRQAREFFHLKPWSLSKFLKYKIKQAVQYVGDFEKALVTEAAEVRADGVICGHIHHPMMCYFDGIQYINAGDWVESLSAIVETDDGELKLVFPEGL